MVDHRAHIIRLLRLAQSGGAQAALSAAEGTLAAADGSRPAPPLHLASLHYVRAVALHCQRQHDRALEAGRSVLRAAESCDDPAWASAGRAFQVLQATLRVESDPDSADGDHLLQELARAEVDIPEASVEPFGVVTAHTAVGGCYLHLRLYELAEPHLQAAADLSAAHPELLQVTAVTSRLNLAYLHLGWSLELRRIGLGDGAAEHSRAARRHADQVATMEVAEGAEMYQARAALLAACADSDVGEPGAVIDAIRAGLDESTGCSQPGDAAMARLFEARALFRAGKSAAALDVVRRVCSERSHHSIGMLAAAAFHTRADLLVMTGSDEDAEILAYGDHLAQALWSQRLRALHLARSMQVFERLRRERDSIHVLAYTDALTGVGSRHAFDDWVTRQATRLDESVCILIVDADDLKAINDAGGHAAGDLILRSIATVLVSQAGPDDLVARLGGDEFVVGAELSGDDGIALARRVVQTVTAVLGGTTSVSVGVACGPAPEAGSTVLSSADHAMYRAKRGGGGRVCQSAPLREALPSG